jgi:hypothetical protein
LLAGTFFGNKVKKKILIRILSVVLLYSSLMTQSIESDNIRFNFDYARFKAADDWSYLEIYLSFPRNSLHYSETEEKLAASYQIAMDLYNEDSLVHTKTRQLTDAVDSLSEVKKGEYIVDIYALYLPPGRYRCITTIKYLFSGIQGSTECEIKIDSFKSDMIKISDIQLGYHIVSQKKAGQFVKNGYYILPNPSGVYGLKWPNLYYYAEIYNLSSLQADQDSTYTVSVCIKDDAGTIIKEMPKKQKIRRGASIAEVGRINVGSLFSGPYQLQVTVIDNAKNDSI